MSETQNHAAPYDNGRIEVGQQLNDGTIPLFDKGPETQCIVALVTENTLDGISRQQGNADRLAACWNTLAGIPTQDLPAVRDLLQWAIGLGNLKSSIPPAVADRLRHLTPAPSAFDDILGQMVEFKYRFGSLISDLEREVMREDGIKMATITQYVCANEPRGKDGLEGFVKGGIYDARKNGDGHYDLYGNPPEHFRGAYIGSAGEKELKRYFHPHTKTLAPEEMSKETDDTPSPG